MIEIIPFINQSSFLFTFLTLKYGISNDTQPRFLLNFDNFRPEENSCTLMTITLKWMLNLF